MYLLYMSLHYLLLEWDKTSAHYIFTISPWSIIHKYTACVDGSEWEFNCNLTDTQFDRGNDSTTVMSIL